MTPLTQVCLFGSLRNSLKNSKDRPYPLDLKEPTPLPEILHSLKIPLSTVQMAMVNFKAVPRDTIIQPGDRLSLFPKEYALFADWKDFRF